jgi:serine/threonine-protein kinase HipA
MSEIRCLGCYKILENKLPGNYHTSCSKKLFGTEIPPEVNFGSNDLETLALKSLTEHLGLTGVQPKISIHLEKSQNDPTRRMMIVDLWGNFILKPPTKQFPQVSIIEDVTMHMATICGLKVARHGLIKLKTGELAYVTKRFDRPKKGKKIAVEDFCQLSELLTENKYDSSMEKAGKIILKHASNSGLDLVSFFDVTLFSFVTGNSDMHLKNFSLLRSVTGDIELAPFYDLLATKLLLPEDHEEMALRINGKKAKLKKSDFISLGQNLKISEKVIENSLKRLLNKVPAMKEMVRMSFLSEELKGDYFKLIDERVRVLK